MTRRQFFVAGTDTGVGKTYVAALLLRAFAAQGKTTLGLKPVAAGCTPTTGGLRNDDALALIAASTVKLPYAQVNPVALVAPVAPHIAAAQENRRLRVAQLAGLVRGATLQGRADITLVEGAGGWRVPLNEGETLADLARELQLPVILVVGLRLGCLNHALLSARAIRADGCELLGWIGNRIDPDMLEPDGNLDTLRARLPAPCLGVIDYRADAASAARALAPAVAALRSCVQR